MKEAKLDKIHRSSWEERMNEKIRRVGGRDKGSLIPTRVWDQYAALKGGISFLHKR